jgi:N-methylhydantoinase A/oxoprolinase/acetone carboxylase beta subunit
MTSAGGLVPAGEGAAKPVSLVLSGPAGGAIAAAAASVASGFPDCVTLDMGGTSTDVCLVLDGRPAPAAERVVGGFPLRVPALDVITIGAGGGSVARLDGAGALAVGPASAGAQPGPACYGLGGEMATVTDADLVAGRLPIEGLGGLGRLDVAAARRALERTGATADGVIAVVDEAMVQAIRSVTVARGVDPRPMALVAFGGAGPLHACALACELGMSAVVVPPRAGVLSAVGILGAPRQVDLVRSWACRSDISGAVDAASRLGNDAATLCGAASAGSVEVAFDCRYAGQSHEIRVSSPADFPCEHRRRRGWSLPDGRIEVVAVRATARAAPPVDVARLTPPQRKGPVSGPAVIAENDCTIWVAEGWRAEVHDSGAWVLSR